MKLDELITSLEMARHVCGNVEVKVAHASSEGHDGRTLVRAANAFRSLPAFAG